jgi:hypothetical protein
LNPLSSSGESAANSRRRSGANSHPEQAEFFRQIGVSSILHSVSRRHSRSRPNRRVAIIVMAATRLSVAPFISPIKDALPGPDLAVGGAWDVSGATGRPRSNYASRFDSMVP